MTLANPNPLQHDIIHPRIVAGTINYLSSHCARPFVNNGDFSQNILPLEKVRVSIVDADSMVTPPSLTVEGYQKVKHSFDITGLGEKPEAAAALRDSLTALIRELSGADEIVTMPVSNVRRQQMTVIGKDIENSVAADFVHGDVTALGAEQVTDYFYARPSRPGMRRKAIYNMWKLLSPSPTNLPLAVCDARSIRPDDIVAGGAFFPSAGPDGSTIDTAFFHPNDHFKWAYFSKLDSQDVLTFKQYDSDSSEPCLVPHSAFTDDTCPDGAAPRVSIENRFMAYWY